jgi:hypothetical protein
MSDPEHLAKLEKYGNCGALTGKPSNGFVAIDIDVNHGVKPFLNLNPLLRQTPRVRADRGEKVLCRIIGPYPETTQTISTSGGQRWGELISTGGMAMVAGIHPFGKPYVRTCEGPLASIAYSDIVFPPGVVKPCLDASDCTQSSEHRPQEGETPSCSALPYASLEGLLAYTALTGTGQTRKRQFETLRGIRGLEAMRGSPFSQPELDDAFERWYDWNRPHLKESKATYQAEFMGRYELAKYPLGSQQMLEDAWNRVATDALPPEVQALPCDEPDLKLMAAFCRELQRMAGPPPKSFFLSSHVLKGLLGHEHHSTCALWFHTLIRYGYLERVKKGTQGTPGEGFPRRASEYRYLKL